MKKVDISLIFAHNIHFEYMLEQPHYLIKRVFTSTHNQCFRAKNKKIIYTPVNPSITILIICACPYSSNIGLSAMTLYYPVQDKTSARLVYTRNYYTKI